MTTSNDRARPEQILDLADTMTTPSAPPKLYDPERNKRWGVVTVEEIQAEYQGQQDALASRIRHDKAHRHQKTWDDVVERASDGIRMRALKNSLQGTKRSTETMVRLTGFTAPTTQTRIQLGDFFPWAAPELQIMMQRSLIEAEPGKGVRDFEMPSDRLIIEMGQAAAKKAGCWGVPQAILITAAQGTVEAVDLPKAIGWQKKRKPPHPFWEDQGPLAEPWQAYRLFIEMREPGQGQDPQPAWCVDLFVRDGEVVTFHERGFIACCTNDVFVTAADALNQLRPHIDFIAAQKAEDAAAQAADLAQWPLLAKDTTGKPHTTLDEIAVKLGMTSGMLAEQLRNRGYLNLQGEATPAALDAGVTTIVNGGTQFCPEVIENLLDEKAEDDEADDTDDALDPPPVESDQATEMENDAETLMLNDPEEETHPTDANPKPQVMVRRGGTGMKTVSGKPQDPPADSRAVDKTRSKPETSLGTDVATPGQQAVEQLENGKETLQSAQDTMGRYTEDGIFVPHSGDNQTLQNRIRVAAEATAKAHAMLANMVTVYQTFEKNIDVLSIQVRQLKTDKEQLETENTELKRRLHEGGREAAGYVEVMTLRASPDAEASAAVTASH